MGMAPSDSGAVAVFRDMRILPSGGARPRFSCAGFAVRMRRLPGMCRVFWGLEMSSVTVSRNHAMTFSTPSATLRKLANPTVKFYQRGKWMSRKIMIEYSFTAFFWGEPGRRDRCGWIKCPTVGGEGSGGMWNRYVGRNPAAESGGAAVEWVDETGSWVPGRRRAGRRRWGVGFPLTAAALVFYDAVGGE